jgi:hypothetical protein
VKLQAALLALCAACALPAHSSAPAPAPVQFLVDGLETAFHDPQVLSIDDANETYEIVLGGKPLPEPEGGHTIALVHGALRLPAQSWGRSGDEGDFCFRATPAEARAFAAALGVPAREREPWRGELSGKLEPVGELAAGAEHLPLRFTLTNTGPVALWFMDGGRGRNELGRDNRFTFAIERDGVRLATRELPDFGGMAVDRKLEPGESHVLELDLAHWIRLERAGKYAVRASYEADLMPGEFEPGKALAMGWYTHLERTRSVQAGLVIDAR